MTKTDLIKEINKLKQEKNAVILAHYYCEPEVQNTADYVGDSFYLAKVAKNTDCERIVFCGVEFMGESAKILNPEKTVLMPDKTADCPMAHMASVEKVLEMKRSCNDLAVVCYINSSAELKSVCDVCVTSSNAVNIVNKLPNKNVFFIPDGNLGRYVAKQSSKNIIFNNGYCPIHNNITVSLVKSVKNAHPSAKILMHPECLPEVAELADYVGSTSGIIEYAQKSNAKEFIVITEIGVLHELQKKAPDKKFYFTEPMPICADMKKVTLKKVYNCLLNDENAVEISEDIRKKALAPLEKMLELG